MPRSKTCQWKPDWNSAPLSVWIDSTLNGGPFQHVVQELDSGLLVIAGVDAQHAYARAVVDGGELVVLLFGYALG